MTRSPTTPRRRRISPIEIVLVLAVLAGAAVLTVVSTGAGEPAVPARTLTAQSPTEPPEPTAPEPTAPEPAAPEATAPEGRDKGERVFLRDCAWCHGDEGEGSQRAPRITDAGEAGAHFQLTTGRMPLQSVDDQVEAGPPAYPPGTVADIVDFVGTLGDGPPVPELQPGTVARGRTAFLYNCAPCHSSSGTGMVLPDGSWAPELFDSTPTQVAEAIRIGPGPMPPFSEAQLDNDHVEDIVTYVEQLGPQQTVGGHPLERLGPIAEGIVVWLLVMPVLVLVIRLLGKKAK